MSEVDDEEEEDDMNDEDGSEDDDEDEDEDEDSDEDDEDDDEEEVTPTKKKSKGRSKGSKKKQTSRKLWSKSVSTLSSTFHTFSLRFLCSINLRPSTVDLTLFSLTSLVSNYRCFYKRVLSMVHRFAFCSRIYRFVVVHHQKYRHFWSAFGVERKSE